jgi:hypothetical protein
MENPGPTPGVLDRHHEDMSGDAAITEILPSLLWGKMTKRKKCQRKISLMKIVDSTLVVPCIIGAEIDHRKSARKRKQESRPFSAEQMEKELRRPSDPNKLQRMAVNATGDRKIST